MIILTITQLTGTKLIFQKIPPYRTYLSMNNILTFLQKMLKEKKIGHIYQRTINGFLLFYTISDFLVFFSIVCVCARRHKIKLLGVCPMFDHTHLLAKVSERKDVSGFVQEYSSLYAREFNISMGTKGSVFRRNYGFAPKTGIKSIRNACSYLYNNPGEKKLCKRAQDYRWTFLAYAISDHPFSEKIILREASKPLRKAVKMIDYYASEGIYLKHDWLERMFAPLSIKEKNQLVDHIIVAYNVIDYKELISYYGSYETTCLAFASNQGNEYDVKEEFVPGSHKVYQEIPKVLLAKHGFKHIKDVMKLPLAKRVNLMYSLEYETRASRQQLCKYLRFKKM